MNSSASLLDFAGEVPTVNDNRRVSLAPSLIQPRRFSLIPSASAASALSRMGSRNNSSDDLIEYVDEVPSTIGNIKEVTDSKEAVMSFYYKDTSNQVCF